MFQDYESCLQLVRGLEAFTKRGIKASPVIEYLADLMYRHRLSLPLLNELAEQQLSMNALTSGKGPQPLTPHELLQAEALEKEISPWITELRKDLFGKEDVPFPNWESALEWLATYDVTEEKAIRELSEFIDRTRDGEVSLVYYEGMVFLPGTPPVIIWERTGEIARKTGANQPSLIMHVLSNTKLACPKVDWETQEVKAKLPSDMETTVRSITMRFRDTLNLQDTRDAHYLAKRRFGFSKSKQMNAKHLELYRLVINHRGWQPRKNKGAFWEQIRVEWNNMHPEAEYITVRGVSLAFDRILNRLGRKPSGKLHGSRRLRKGDSDKKVKQKSKANQVGFVKQKARNQS